MKTRLPGIRTLHICLAVVTFLAGGYANPASANRLETNLDQDHINIDFLYHGSEVSVSGQTDPGVDIIVRVTSTGDKSHELMKQGKVGGVLWMKVGRLEFDHLPTFYYLRSTRPLDEILNSGEQAKHLLGYTALENQANVTPVTGAAEKDQWFGEFVAYKQEADLYSVASGDITVRDTPSGRTFQHTVHWPYQAGTGMYTLSVYAVKDGRVVESTSMPVQVEPVGLVRTLASMAFNNGSLYGMLSILAALGAGLGVGMVFRKNSGAH